MKKVIIEDIRKQDFHYAEAIKTLQTNIQFAGKNTKVVMITSCFPNEGKSDITLSLAKEMAASGKRVLLLDADIRKSSFISRFRIQEKVYGLSQYLSGQITPQDLIYMTNYHNMNMIFSGPSAPNPTNLLGDEVFAMMMDTLRQHYDYIFVDTPPISSVIDAAVVAQRCDGAIMVVESEAVSYRAVQKALAQIEKSGCNILGGVLNKVDTKRNKYYSSYYNKKYGEYYKKSEEYMKN
ncbi:MAG: CpsD/CapB family tyrosine-protein kinase [Eubacteriales bacterium]|nr:CpsD/CapB family tyrosine-protein kinase [Eubacteriales bacterium]